MSNQEVFRRMESYTERNKQLFQERDDIHASAFRDPDSLGDCRRNPAARDEAWALDNQLAHGPRLAPHVGR